MNEDSHHQTPRTRAGIAGSVAGVSGTLLTALVESMPDSVRSKNFLLLSVPTVTLLIGTAYFFCYKQALTLWLERQERRAVERAARIAREALNDEWISESDKAQIKQKMGAVHIAQLNAEIEKQKGFQDDQKHLNHLEQKIA